MRTSLMTRIDWGKFDSSKVDERLLRLVKGACLVEFNSDDYVSYLEKVFADDSAFLVNLRKWGDEERQHGMALARWAKLADPAFDFEQSLESFRRQYSIKTDVSGSIRGSRTLELIARCLVETGTSTYYKALADLSKEPVLSQICREISAEEVRHYSFFLKLLPKWQQIEKVGILSRIKMAIVRSIEAQDAELTTAYSCGIRNGQSISCADLKKDSDEFIASGYQIYKKKHLDMFAKMAFNAVGISRAKVVVKPSVFALERVFQYQRWSRPSQLAEL